MTKLEFLSELDRRLAGVSAPVLTRSIEYYSEIIDERMEEGVPEEEAVAALGSIDVIVSQIMSEIPVKKPAKEKVKEKRKYNVWEILLASLGFLIVGLPVLLSLFSVALGIYASLWAVAISLFTVPIALVGGIFSIFKCFYLIATASVAGGFFNLGIALISLGLVVPFFYVAKYFMIFTLTLTKGIFLLIKKPFTK